MEKDNRLSARIQFEKEPFEYMADYKKSHKVSMQDFVTEAVNEKIEKLEIEKLLNEQ